MLEDPVQLGFVPRSPWNGAFVATVPSEDCTLTGYAADGTVLGTV